MIASICVFFTKRISSSFFCVCVCLFLLLNKHVVCFFLFYVSLFYSWRFHLILIFARATLVFIFLDFWLLTNTHIYSFLHIKFCMWPNLIVKFSEFLYLSSSLSLWFLVFFCSFCFFSL